MALRVMAGFETTDGYFLPRGRLDPPKELVNMIWPWLDSALAYVMTDEDKLNPTARYFLEFLQILRTIILQDAAAMFVILGGEEVEEGEQRRLYHSIFNLPVFQSELFLSFVEEMRVKLAEATDPNDTAIEKALPGVNRKFDDVVQTLEKLYKQGEDAVEERREEREERRNGQQRIEDYFRRAEQRAEERHAQTATALVDLFQHGADVIRGTMAVRPPGADVIRGTMAIRAPLEARAGGAAESAHQEQREETAEGQEEPAEPQESDADQLARMRLGKGHHVSFRNGSAQRILLLDMYKEYHGLDKFKGLPIDGGYYGLEKKFKNKWRAKIYSDADNSFFGRLKALMASLASSAGVEEGVLDDELLAKAADWQRYLRDGGLSGAVTKLQDAGLVPLGQGASSKQGWLVAPKMPALDLH